VKFTALLLETKRDKRERSKGAAYIFLSLIRLALSQLALLVIKIIIFLSFLKSYIIYSDK